MNYDVRAWYWRVNGSTTQVWSSQAKSYVSIDDTTYQTWLAGGGLVTPILSENELWDVLIQQAPDIAKLIPEALAKMPRRLECQGVVRFTVAGGVVTIMENSFSVDGVTRVSAGRYRIFPTIPDVDLLTGVESIQDIADVRARVTARIAAYVEVRTVTAAGAAIDVTEVVLTFNKVMI